MAVQSLLLICCKAILDSTIIQSACGLLPPKLLQYLLYQAVILQNTSWIQGLVRYWPLETLSFDFDDFIDYTDITNTNIRDRSESYLRRNHSWFHSPDHYQMRLQSCVVNSIAIGLYLRAYHCHSVNRNKQCIVDMTMVKLSSADLHSDRTSHPLRKLCHGIPLQGAPCDSDRVTVTSEKLLILLNVYCTPDHPILSCFNTSPCALQSRFVVLRNETKAVTPSLLLFKNITSLHCTFESSKFVADFAEILTVLQEKLSNLNEFIVTDFRSDDDHLDVDFSMPAIACRRIDFTTIRFTRLFNCAYHPLRKLESFYIDSHDMWNKLEFNSEISKIIIHNCNSLLDLRMSGVTVPRNNSLLQQTLQKCHALVVLSIRYPNNGSFSCARMHEIFYSIQGLLNLTYLDVADNVNVFGEDLHALHNLLYQNLPKLKDCCLSFSKLVIYFTLLGDKKYKFIQELLGMLLSGKQPSPDCHTVAFGWRSNQIVLDWLAGLCCSVNFQLL